MHYLKYPSFSACCMPRFDFFALIFVCKMYLDTIWMPRPIGPKEEKSLRIRICAVPCFFSAELFVLFLSDFASHPRLRDVSYCRRAQILRYVSYGRCDQPLSYVSYCRYAQIWDMCHIAGMLNIWDMCYIAGMLKFEICVILQACSTFEVCHTAGMLSLWDIYHTAGVLSLLRGASNFAKM